MMVMMVMMMMTLIEERRVEGGIERMNDTPVSDSPRGHPGGLSDLFVANFRGLCSPAEFTPSGIDLLQAQKKRTRQPIFPDTAI